jgi:hypothetical protein
VQVTLPPGDNSTSENSDLQSLAAVSPRQGRAVILPHPTLVYMGASLQGPQMPVRNGSAALV